MTSKKLLFLLLLNFVGFGQNQKKIDSLENKLKIYDLNNKRLSVTIHDSVKVNLLLKICQLYNTANPTKQYSYGEKAFVLSEKINYTKGAALSCIAKARAKNDIGKYKEGTVLANKAIKIATTLNEPKILGDAYFCLAQTYIFQTNLPEATFNLNKALLQHEKAKDYMGLAIDYNNIAIVNLKLGDDKKTLLYFKKIIQLLTKHPSEKGNNYKNLINSNIAFIYHKQGKNKLALKIFKECLVIDSLAGRTIGEAYNKINIGKCYLGFKLPNQALKYLNESKTIFLQSENNSALGDNYRYIGEAYFLLNNYTKAIENTKIGLHYSKSIGDLEAMKFGYEQLYEIYQKTENYKLAFENHLLFKKVSDSMMNSDVKNKITQIQLTHNFNKKYDNLKTVASEKSTRQKNIIYAVIGILVLLSVFTFGVYKNLKRQQRQKKIIQKQNLQIHQSLKEKEILLKEIHHRVKNNLQIISSLLNIQAEDIEDEKILASLHEGQSRVEAMSLIHQNLYQSELINNVNFQKYITDLTNYLSQMYATNSKNISIEITSGNIEFDIDTAIPLGLIVNELVSNAFKYAFTDLNEGKITISIQKLENNLFQLQVSDNGKGLPDSFDISTVKSLGLSLVTMLTDQIDGTLEIKKEAGNLAFIIQFKNFKSE